MYVHNKLLKVAWHCHQHATTLRRELALAACSRSEKYTYVSVHNRRYGHGACASEFNIFTSLSSLSFTLDPLFPFFHFLSAPESGRGRLSVCDTCGSKCRLAFYGIGPMNALQREE